MPKMRLTLRMVLPSPGAALRPLGRSLNARQSAPPHIGPPTLPWHAALGGGLLESAKLVPASGVG